MKRLHGKNFINGPVTTTVSSIDMYNNDVGKRFMK